MSSKDIAKSFGYLTNNEIDCIHSFVAKLPNDSIIVNIGAGAGTSGLALYETRPNDIWLYTIDLQESSSPFGCLEGERNAFEQAGFGYTQPNHFQVAGDSKAVGKEWEGSVDLLFVDGDHSYNGCTGDIESWLPHMKHGGYMLFHDYGSPRWPGVKSAVDRLFGDRIIVISDTVAVVQV